MAHEPHVTHVMMRHDILNLTTLYVRTVRLLTVRVVRTVFN